MVFTWAFTWAFVVALVISTLLRWWLDERQIRHVLSHRQQVPVEFRDAVSLAEHGKAADYTVARVRLGRIDLILGAAVLMALTLGGGIHRVDAAWQALPLSSVWHGVAVMASVLLLMAVMDLPLSWYRTFHVEARFGFNRTTSRTFVLDLLKGMLLAALLGLPLLWVLLSVMASAGQWWWAYAWAIWLGFSLAISWAWPIFIAPLFNKFSPLQDGQLKERIEQLLRRCQFNASGVYVMDGSSRSSHGNAYFTGFGRNKRIVFFDTLVERLTPAQIEAVLAHELGHYRLKHIRQGLILSGILSLIAFAALGGLAAWPGFYSALGVDQPSDHAALLLFLLASGPFTFFLTPIMAAWSRRHEFQADEFAARHADAHELIAALVKLYRDNANTLTPDAWHSRFYDSHPPAMTRIAFLQSLRLKQPVPTA